MKTSKRKSKADKNVPYNLIHQACKHIDYLVVVPLKQRDLYVLATADEKLVALVEVEGNEVTITQ